MTTSFTGEKNTGLSETGNGQELMLKARENALNAKEEARKAIGQVYEKSRYVNPLDETLVRIFGETEQSINEQTRQLLGKNGTDTTDEDYEIPFSSAGFTDKLPIDIYPEIKRRTAGLPFQRPTANLSEEDIRKGIDNFIEETKKIKKEAQQALNEADITRQAARVTASRAKQEALKIAGDEISRSQEENRIIRENAETAVRQAREETCRYREEVEAARNHTRVAIALAQDKIKEASEIVAQAHEESRQAREAAQIARHEAGDAKEKAEASIRRVNEQITRARQIIINTTQQEVTDSESPQETRPDVEFVPHQMPVVPTISESGYPALEKNSKPISNDVFKELYNPLHSISGFARMMLDDNIADTAAQKEFLTIILQQSENLKQELDRLSH